MASVALSFSTEPIAGLRFPFAGFCFLLLKLCAKQMFCDGSRRPLFLKSFLVLSERPRLTIHPAGLPLLD